ncbi:MAG: autoinducer 2-degrading protein [Candidatus Azotimanducaceae bacterium]
MEEMETEKTGKIVLSGFITVPEVKIAIVLAHLTEHSALTLRESGCLVFEVKQRVDESCIFDVYEEFKDAQAFASHQERVRASAWGEVTQDVQRCYEVTGL